ncbi:MAG: transcriptional repressor [Bacteroidaceae bacterium]|nr:transcriptional repressor [Bacteroidaceae bacterium]
METAEGHLREHGVKPTAVRILVWKEIWQRESTFSLTDVEECMPDMDRSSIFRALRLFVDNHLLHEIDDGTGHQKYCVCRCCDEHHISHVHFTCLKCGKTCCLHDYTIPIVNLPEGYTMSDAEYVIKGLCPKCRQP